MRSVDTCSACRSVRGLLFAVVLCSVVGLPGPVVLADMLKNGDFSSGLDYWDSSGDVQPLAGDNVAVLSSDGGAYPYFEQAFTIPDGSVSLSFRYKPNYQGWGSFTALLLDDTSWEPLVPTYDQYPPDGVADELYFMYDRNELNPSILNSPYVTAGDFTADGWQTVTLDLSARSSPDALIAFDFVATDAAGTVLLDNVSLTVVPVPPAVVLFVLGMGTAGAMLRRRLGRTA